MKDTTQRFRSFVINAHDQPASTKTYKEPLCANQKKHDTRIAIERHQEQLALSKALEGSYED